MKTLESKPLTGVEYKCVFMGRETKKTAMGIVLSEREYAEFKDSLPVLEPVRDENGNPVCQTDCLWFRGYPVIKWD